MSLIGATIGGLGNSNKAGYIIEGKSTVVVSGGYNSIIPGTPSSSYNWLERAADFEKLDAAKKPLMKVKEWLDYKKLEKVIDEKWGGTKDNNSNGEEGEGDRPRTYLLYGD